MFGAVAIQGAHADLLKGLENAAHDENASTDLWVSPAGAYNLLRTAPFTARASEAGRPAGYPLGAAVQRRPPGLGSAEGVGDGSSRRSDSAAAPTQILEGSRAQATARLRAGGWAVLSEALAARTQPATSATA